MTHNARHRHGQAESFALCFRLFIYTTFDGSMSMVSAKRRRFTRKYHAQNAMHRLCCVRATQWRIEKLIKIEHNVETENDDDGETWKLHHIECGSSHGRMQRQQQQTPADTHARCTRCMDRMEHKYVEEMNRFFRSVFWDSPFSWNSLFARTRISRQPTNSRRHSRISVCCFIGFSLRICHVFC